MENRVGRTRKVLHKTLCSAVSILMVLLMALSVFSVAVYADDEPAATEGSVTVNAQDDVKREINVVFDNSSSMYEGTDRWSYATYAMEAFVAMLNSNDTLRVYPLNPITTTGRTSGSTDPITISGSDKEAGIDLINNMFSSKAGQNTHFPPVKNAAAGFTGSDTEKYLVIISDGKFTEDTETGSAKELDADYVNSEIEKIASTSGINAIYLRIGASSTIKADSLKLNLSSNDQDDIIESVNRICNYIFGRIELDDDYYDDDSLELEISMKKIIIFAQENDAYVGQITLSNGTVLNPVVQNITYSTKGSPDNFKVNKELNGCVGTFEYAGGIAAGEHSMKCDGDLTIFYEPNIDVAYNLIDTSTGKPVVPNEKNEIDSGEYKIDLYFVDALTGEDITDSELIKGENDNTLSATVRIEGQPDAVVEDGDSVVLSANKNTDITVKGTYLDYYTITGSGKNGLHNFTVVDNPFECKISIENDYFCTLNADSWESFVVNFEVDKHAVTADDFAKISLSEEDITIKDGKNDYNIAYDLTRDEENCCYKIRFKIPEGKSAASVCGKGTITVTAEYLLGGGVAEDSDKQSFEISTLPQWLKILIIVGSILLAILLIIFILTRKVYPKYMFIDVDGRKNRVNVSRGSTVIKPSGSMDAVTLSLKPTMNVFQKFFLKKNKVGVTGFNPSGAIDSFSFGTYSFQKDADGSWPEECLKLKRPTNLSLGHTAFQWTTENDFCGGNVSLRK